MLQAVSCLIGQTEINRSAFFFLLGAIFMCEALTMSINGKIRGGGGPIPSEGEVASRWAQDSHANEGPNEGPISKAPLEIKCVLLSG